jgi:hypothetical protein
VVTIFGPVNNSSMKIDHFQLGALQHFIVFVCLWFVWGWFVFCFLFFLASYLWWDSCYGRGLGW